MRLLLITLALGGFYMSPSYAQRRLQQQDPIMVDGAVGEHEVELSSEAMIESIRPTNATTSVPAKAPHAAATAAPIIPINALLYSNSPGPKECRGTPIFKLNLPKPAPSGPNCYNMASVASCGTFMANMEDGCQTRLFAEPNCLSFVNLAVFTPELRPVGGLIRSIEVTCGIQSVQPAPLNLNLPAAQKPAQGGK
ncbi:hypothetical protein BJ170DRAFT_163845 [Xylariales sp. AK1849]|nr:hypothetical protein BJ170DRAFT_163845 [Xylariales sp. AK1849]